MTEAKKTQSSSLAKASDPLVVGSTLLPKRELSYRWVIHDAKIFLNQCSQGVKSPTFSVSLPLQTQLESFRQREHDLLWYLLIRKQHLVIYVSLCHAKKEGSSRNKSEVWVTDIAFSFIDLKTDEILHTRKLLNGAKFAVNVSASSNESQISEYKNIDRYLSDGKLTIQVSATLHCITDPTQTTEECELSQDNARAAMKTMFADKLFTDVTIKCGDEEFKAHKAVLASQSPVFRRMFETNMKEQKANEIEIPDFDSKVIQEVLTYLYSGSVSNMNTHDRVKDLFEIADKYEISQLLAMCEKKLRLYMNTTNVIELLVLADLHNVSSLKKACLNYIHHNSATVYASSKWKQLVQKENRDSYLSLVMEVLEYAP